MIATSVISVQANDLVSMLVKDGSGVARQPTPCDGFLIKAGGTTIFVPRDLMEKAFYTLPETDGPDSSEDDS
jgi:hypothetical protein